MTVLTLAGKPIDWARAPKRTATVLWHKRDKYGRQVTGSLRAIAHLDHLDTLAQKRFGVGIVVIQPPNTKGLKISEGTHDFDMCFDVEIPGVPWLEAQSFLRANGAAAYYRRPPSFSPHIHFFSLPPREGTYVNDDYAVGGFKVGKYVDGGYSLYGRKVGSSQIEDYYDHRTALSGHAKDPTWFPPNIEATIFDLAAYNARQRAAQSAARKGPDELVILNSHAPLARLGGAKGAALWRVWESSVRARADERVQRRVSVAFSVDSNKHGALPNFGAGIRRIGGRGIDLIAKRRARGGAKIQVLKHRVVDLKIDGHDGYGVKVRVIFPSGRRVKFWIVQANLGRKGSAALFRESCVALRKAFGKNAVYNFQEIDEADLPDEHKILRQVFPEKDFGAAGWKTLSPTLVGKRRLRISKAIVTKASSGLPKVSPLRVIVETTLTTR